MMGPSPKIGRKNQKIRKENTIFKSRALGLVMDRPGPGDRSSVGWGSKNPSCDRFFTSTDAIVFTFSDLDVSL